jgi:adenylate cyclase
MAALPARADRPEIDVSALFEWLIDGAPGAVGPVAVVAHMGPAMVARGVPISRMAAFVRTLHPSIMGRSFVWRADRAEVEVREAPYSVLVSPTFAVSAAGRVFSTGQPLRRRIALAEEADSVELVKLRDEGMTDYLGLPLRFLDGQVHAVTFCTDHPDGFSDDHVRALTQLSRPLARVAEILALRRTATNLLNAYVGRDAGERILQGKVQRGDTEIVRCVIWFSDLRGFTTLSQASPAEDIILVLNRIFDCQVPMIEQQGGQVLKFMGDGLLAIFPIPSPESVDSVAPAALAAALAAHGALERLNEERHAVGESPLDFGVSLHIGDVAYGNIGGEGRLDFTCIGAAVNLASRIEGLTGKLGHRLLLSEAFAAVPGVESVEVGRFPLKGVEGEVTVYAPAPGPRTVLS